VHYHIAGTVLPKMCYVLEYPLWERTIPGFQYTGFIPSGSMYFAMILQKAHHKNDDNKPGTGKHFFGVQICCRRIRITLPRKDDNVNVYKDTFPLY
jgi:hypothetical protein